MEYMWKSRKNVKDSYRGKEFKCSRLLPIWRKKKKWWKIKKESAEVGVKVRKADSSLPMNSLFCNQSDVMGDVPYSMK